MSDYIFCINLVFSFITSVIGSSAFVMVFNKWDIMNWITVRPVIGINSW
jgi:hypothetical protein